LSTRRTLLLALSVSAFGLVSCSKKTEANGDTTPTASVAAASTEKPGGDLTVGFIYVGPKDDYGYNQAHAEGAKFVASMPGVKIREEEKVPESMEVQKTMESMINLDQAKLLFPTSFGYFDPHILKLADKYK